MAGRRARRYSPSIRLVVGDMQLAEITGEDVADVYGWSSGAGGL